MSDVGSQVLDILQIKPKEAETAEQFTQRATERLHKLSDEAWEELPEEVQAWVVANKNALATDQPLDLLELPGQEGADEDADAPQAAEETDEELVEAMADVEAAAEEPLNRKRSAMPKAKEKEEKRPRRRFDDDEKKAIVAESYGDETQTAVAERHGISIGLLGQWRKDKRWAPKKVAAAAEKPAKAPERVVTARKPGRPPGRPAAPRVAAAPASKPMQRVASPRTAPAAHANGAGPVEIAVGAITVRIPAGADAATISTYVDVVKQLAT